MTDYLSDRTQRVFYNNEYSSSVTLKCGTPQGSQLGPLLFAIYVNDIINCSRILDFSLYADDSNAGAAGADLCDLYALINRELCLMNRWIKSNGLSTNNVKLLHILFSGTNVNVNYVIRLGDSIVKKGSHTKLLGLLIDERLKWDQHVLSISKKISKLCGIMYLVRKKLNDQSLITIYYSLIYSHVTYCISIWGGTWLCHLKPLISAQKRFVKLIFYSTRYDRSLPLFVEHKLLCLDYIYRYFSGLVIFKFLNLGYCTDVFSEAHNAYALRRNYNNVAVPFFRTSRGQRSILFTAPTIWNNLPLYLKTISNINRFKRLYKRFLLQHQSNQLH